MKKECKRVIDGEKFSGPKSGYDTYPCHSHLGHSFALTFFKVTPLIQKVLLFMMFGSLGLSFWGNPSIGLDIIAMRNYIMDRRIWKY